MRWITHIALSFLFIKIVEISFLVDLSSSVAFWAVMPLYSVLADFDSIAGIKHRTYSHAIYAPFILSLPLIPFPELYAVAIISYLSHIFADMLTPSGVMLLYPYRQTTFSFLPPAWRIGTGTNAEMIFLIAVLLLTASFSLAESTKEVDKIFMYRENADIWVDVSFYENGVLKSFKNEKIVWDDGNSKIGIIHNGRLKIINVKQIKSIKIKEMQEVERTERELRTSVKALRIVNHLITAYRTDGDWIDYLGTGKDLYYLLFNGSNGNQKLWIRVVE